MPELSSAPAGDAPWLLRPLNTRRTGGRVPGEPTSASAARLMAGKALRLTIVTNNQGALKGISTVSTKAGALSRAFAGMSTHAKTGFSGISAAMNASGLTGQFGMLQSMLYNVSGAFDEVGEAGKASFGKLVVGAGVGMAAIGGLGELLGGPLEQAQAQLKQSIDNTGASFSHFQAPIGKVISQMAVFGHTSVDTDSALSELTAGTGSTTKALSYMGFAANLAAKDHESLASAASTTVQILAGNTRVLKQFGINITSITAAGKAAVSAHKAAATAATELTAKERTLGQLEARLGVARQTKGVAGANALANAQAAQARAATEAQSAQASAANTVANAQAAVASAGEKLQATQAKIATGSVSATTAQSDCRSAAKGARGRPEALAGPATRGDGAGLLAAKGR